MEVKDLSNITFKDESYDIQGNKITCRLVCKVNLKEFESQSFYFTDSFINNTIARYLPIVKVIRKETDDIYESKGDIVAKYYIYPEGKARIMYFDNEYFNNVRNRNNEKYKNRKVFNYKPGDIISVRQVANASTYMHEVSEQYYLETFIVTGTAVCAENDEFNEELGKNIALVKAMQKANNKVGLVCLNINHRMSQTVLNLDRMSKEFINKNNECKKLLKSVE